jgi:hypothetical protein
VDGEPWPRDKLGTDLTLWLVGGEGPLYGVKSLAPQKRMGAVCAYSSTCKLTWMSAAVQTSGQNCSFVVGDISDNIVAKFIFRCAYSSMDRALASGARNMGSTPLRRTKIRFFSPENLTNF